MMGNARADNGDTYACAGLPSIQEQTRCLMVRAWRKFPSKVNVPRINGHIPHSPWAKSCEPYHPSLFHHTLAESHVHKHMMSVKLD